MNPNNCQQLEDALVGALAPREREAFDEHLEQCSACREAVESQQSLDQLLRQAVVELEPIPAGLSRRIDANLRVDRRRRESSTGARRRIMISLAAAASLALVACGWSLWRSNSQVASNSVSPEIVNSTDEQEMSQPSDPPVAPAPDPRSLVRVEPTDPTQAIYVPVKTRSPNVTIVWTFPTINAERLAMKSED